jgi:hypothetical protein
MPVSVGDPPARSAKAVRASTLPGTTAMDGTSAVTDLAPLVFGCWVVLVVGLGVVVRPALLGEAALAALEREHPDLARCDAVRTWIGLLVLLGLAAAQVDASVAAVLATVAGQAGEQCDGARSVGSARRREPGLLRRLDQPDLSTLSGPTWAEVTWPHRQVGRAVSSFPGLSPVSRAGAAA